MNWDGHGGGHDLQINALPEGDATAAGRRSVTLTLSCFPGTLIPSNLRTLARRASHGLSLSGVQCHVRLAGDGCANHGS